MFDGLIEVRRASTMSQLFRHAWILFIGATCVNALLWWNRGRAEAARNPELAPGYRALVGGFLIYGNLPWLVMGLGIVAGGVPSVAHYFDPRNGPFVILFYVTIVALWVASTHWVFVRSGAEALVRHPGLLKIDVEAPWAIKMFLLLSLAGGVAGLAAMLSGAIRVPR